MGPALKKILEIGSNSFATSAAAFGVDQFDKLGECGIDLRKVLFEKNGFFCFESALRFFPSATTESSWSLHEWNSHELWKRDYHSLAENYFCFAEDIFGAQFCFLGKEIVSFNPETAEFEKLASTLDDWAAKILENYKLMTGYRFAHEWQEVYGPLPARQRLMPKKPFVLGGEYALANLVAIDAVHLMRNMGNLAHQIHRLPDGAQVDFKIL